MPPKKPVRNKSPSATKRLEIKRPELRANLLALLTKVQSSEAARDAFIENPATAISRSVTKQRLSSQQASNANRLLFALLANDKMRKWIGSYEPTSTGAKGKEELARALSEQLRGISDPAITTALFGVALAGDGLPGLSNVAYQCVYNELPNKYSCTCTPVAKNQISFEKDGIEPEMIRSLSEALVDHAKSLAREGVLADMTKQVL